MTDLNPITSELQEKVLLTINGQDQIYEFDQLGVNFDSTEREVLTALEGIIRESNLSLVDDEDAGEFIYTVKKSTNTRMIHVYPKDPAGN